MCIYIHIYVYIYLYLYMYVYVQIYMYTFARIYIYTYVYMYLYIYVYLYVYIHKYIHTCTYIYTYACIQWYVFQTTASFFLFIRWFCKAVSLNPQKLSCHWIFLRTFFWDGSVSSVLFFGAMTYFHIVCFWEKVAIWNAVQQVGGYCPRTYIYIYIYIYIYM